MPVMIAKMLFAEQLKRYYGVRNIVPKEWFVKTNDQIQGPLSASQLKQLADTGKVTPTHLACQGAEGTPGEKWAQAAKVKVLFASSVAKEPDSNPSTPTGYPDPPNDEAHSATSIRESFDAFQQETRGANVELRAFLAEIENRLNGMDGLGVSSADNELQPETILSNWSVQIEKNPLDDSTVHNVTCPAGDGLNATGESPLIVLRQTGLNSGSGTEVLVVFGEFFSEDDLAVTVRIGNRKATKQRWGPLFDNTGTYHVGNQEKKRHFIRDIAQSGSLVIAARPYESNPITAVWDCTQLKKTVVANVPGLHWWFE
jgi:hypothetical protein